MLIFVQLSIASALSSFQGKPVENLKFTYSLFVFMV